MMDIHELEIERTKLGSYNLGFIHGRNAEEVYWKHLSIWQFIFQRKNRPEDMNGIFCFKLKGD